MMTYQDFIQNIIKTRGQWGIPDTEYYENHHIVPNCLGGESDTIRDNFYKKSTNKNCIRLYPKEHYYAHKLLAEENKDNYKLIYAWHRICMCKRELVTEEEYETLKLLRHNRGLTEEHKKKIGEANKGNKRPDLATYNTLHKKGSKDSEQTHNKKCKAQSGKFNNNAKRILNVDKNIVYDTLTEAAKSVGGTKSNMCYCLKTKNFKYKGYLWKYLD